MTQRGGKTEGEEGSKSGTSGAEKRGNMQKKIWS